MAMLSIGMLIHAKHLTGSFTAAGIVDGAYALSLAIGGPLLGQLVDRRGQTTVLLASAFAAAALLFVLAVMPAGVPLPALGALAIGIGLAVPPVGACLRALFPGLLEDEEALRVVYAVDATAVELTWILRPAAGPWPGCRVVHRRGACGCGSGCSGRLRRVRRAAGVESVAA
jgi:MFS family permease